MNQINTISLRDDLVKKQKAMMAGLVGSSEYDRLEENVNEIDMLVKPPPREFESPFKRSGLVSQGGMRDRMG